MKIQAEQLKKILEYNDVQIVEDHGTRYTITCPNCKKPEAYIEYSGDMRWIKCNRENNCYKDDRPAYNKKLWNFIKEFKEYTPLKIVDKFKDTKLKVYGPIIWKMTKSTSNITFDTFMGFYYPFISFLFWSNLKDQTIELLDKGFEKYHLKKSIIRFRI